MEIITGFTGESHITSADDASLYRGILGSDDYVLDVGNKFAATIIDNNTVRIADGDLVIQGHQARIRANDYNEVTIDNGTPGQKRNDLIVARYQKNTTTGIESITLEVVKGTPGETATDPDIIQEDLSTGGTQRDFALYRVSLNGLALESVTSLFTVIPNLKDFMTHQADYAALLAGGTPIKLTLENGWTGDLYVRRNVLGQVTIYGEVTSGTVASGTRITSLPEGCKPAAIAHIVAYIGRTGVRTFTGLVVSINSTLVIFEPASDILSEGWAGIRINATYQSEY